MHFKRKETIFTGTTSQEPEAYEKIHGEIARRAAEEGIVLLKNEEHLLPLKKGSKLALFGSGASRTVKGGTGSGDVNERKSISIFEGLKDAGFVITTEKWLREYEEEYKRKRLEWKEEILEKTRSGTDFFTAYSTSPFQVPAGPEIYTTDADVAVFVLARNAGEGADRRAEKGDYFLSDEEYMLLSDICDKYEKVILLLNSGGVVDLSFLEKLPKIQAVLTVSQPGQEGGTAVADVISGLVSPGGKLTDTWAVSYNDYPNAGTFSHNNGNIEKEKYEEGIYVGYRYFDTFEIPVRYGFGYGLSYASFTINTAWIETSENGEVRVKVKVRNSSQEFSGKEVVQLYVSLPVGKLEKEFRRLCAFSKTRILAPKEEETIELTFDAQTLASFDESRAAWILEPGCYGIYVGSSLGESTLEGILKVKQEKVLAETEHICPLRETLEELSAPTDKVRKRYEALVNNSENVPCFSYDLVGNHTVRYCYDDKETEDEASRITRELSEDQLISLAVGDPGKGQGSNLGAAGISVPGSAGETSSCAAGQGVKAIALADGPAGLRLSQDYAVSDGKVQMLPFEAAIERGFLYDGPELEGDIYYQYCTAFPVGTLLAQTWNEELIQEVGNAVGEEMERFKVTLWLAPGMNIHRNPLCGRNFEYYSEDPFLSGKIAAAMTKGVQKHSGCGTTVKHFACNNQEDNRSGSDSILSERTLREIYLRGFEIVIREAQPFAMMTSYNLINGIHAANNYDLCTKAARCEYGFQGLIMTDWTTTQLSEDCTAAGCIRAGNDLVMPGEPEDQENIRQALSDGTVSEKELRDCVTRIVRTALK
nr:glycoside hydrolase family 3 C-terminal domain-containing protein [uncultured Sellimonas sp.]